MSHCDVKRFSSIFMVKLSSLIARSQSQWQFFLPSFDRLQLEKLLGETKEEWSLDAAQFPGYCQAKLIFIRQCSLSTCSLAVTIFLPTPTNTRFPFSYKFYWNLNNFPPRLSFFFPFARLQNLCSIKEKRGDLHNCRSEDILHLVVLITRSQVEEELLNETRFSSSFSFSHSFSLSCKIIRNRYFSVSK